MSHMTKNFMHLAQNMIFRCLTISFTNLLKNKRKKSHYSLQRKHRDRRKLVQSTGPTTHLFYILCRIWLFSSVRPFPSYFRSSAMQSSFALCKEYWLFICPSRQFYSHVSSDNCIFVKRIRETYSHARWENTHTHTHTHTHTYIYIYISFCIYSIAWLLICDHWFHAVFIRQSSERKKLFSSLWLPYKNGIKPVVADKQPCY